MTISTTPVPSGLAKWVTNKTLFIVILLLTIPILVDTSVTGISVFTGGLGTPMEQLLIFTFIFISSVIGQYFILNFLKSRIQSIRRQSMGILLKPTIIVSFFIMLVITLLILQMIFTRSYSSLGFKTVVWINFVMSSSLLAFLAYRFIVWSKKRPNSIVIAYAIAVSTLSVNCMISLIYVTHQISLLNPQLAGNDSITPKKSPLALVGGLSNVVNSVYQTSLFIAFITTWFVTVLLLHHHSRSTGAIKYWIIISLPLVYFLSQFQSVFPTLFSSLREDNPIFFGIISTLFFNASRPVGGILFGAALYNTVKNVNKAEVKDYMLFSAYGMILLFASNQPVALTLMPYPPFGLVTISILGLSSYLFVLGIYATSLSVANDVELIRFMKKSMQSEYELLRNIGQAYREEIQLEQIKSKVITVTEHLKDKIDEESGIKSSLEIEDMKQYMQKVIDEVKK